MTNLSHACECTSRHPGLSIELLYPLCIFSEAPIYDWSWRSCTQTPIDWSTYLQYQIEVGRKLSISFFRTVSIGSFCTLLRRPPCVLCKARSPVRDGMGSVVVRGWRMCRTEDMGGRWADGGDVGWRRGVITYRLVGGSVCGRHSHRACMAVKWVKNMKLFCLGDVYSREVHKEQQKREQRVHRRCALFLQLQTVPIRATLTQTVYTVCTGNPAFLTPWWAFFFA